MKPKLDETECRVPLKFKVQWFIVEEHRFWKSGELRGCERRLYSRTREAAFELAFGIIERIWEKDGLKARVLNPQRGDYTHFEADDPATGLTRCRSILIFADDVES